MIVTKDFTKALNRIFFVAICLACLSIVMAVFGMSGYSLSEPNSNTTILLLRLRAIIPSAAFWFFVAFLTKENKGALIAFLLHLVSWGYITFQLLSHGYSNDYYYWPGIISSTLGYAAFGLIYFKNTSGLYLLLIYPIMRGIGIGADYYAYYDLLNGLLRLVDLRNLLEIRIPLSENSYRPVNLFVPFVSQMYLPLSLVIFWFVFSTTRYFKKLDISFRTVQLFSKLNNLSFSIVFWIFRIPLFVTVFGVISYMDRAFDTVLNFERIFDLASFCVALFVIGSLYRNFLSAYFVSKGLIPGWNYFLLNVPILNLFAWIFLMRRPAELEADSSKILNNNKDTDANEQVMQANNLQKKFVKGTENKGIKVLILLFMIVSFIIKLERGGADVQNVALFSLFSLISFGLTIWYFSHKNALYVLFSIQALLLLVIGAFKLESLIHLTSIFAAINILVYYTLFHFDKLNFVSSELQ